MASKIWPRIVTFVTEKCGFKVYKKQELPGIQGKTEKVKNKKECTKKCEEDASCTVVQFTKNKKENECILSTAPTEGIEANLKGNKKSQIFVKENCEGIPIFPTLQVFVW